LESIVTLVHLLVGAFVVWFSCHAVADRIKDRKLRKFIEARVAENQRNKR